MYYMVVVVVMFAPIVVSEVGEAIARVVRARRGQEDL